MKKHLIILCAIAIAAPVFAQQTNELHRPKDEKHGERRHKERREMSPEQKAEMHERRLQLLEKTLKKIGVTEEQKAQIIELQQIQREEMKAAFKKVEEQKRKLSELEKTGASEEEIFAAIDAVSDAQAGQMKILARNRIKMERILGKEKFQLFMESARTKWREHGRRGGSGMPKKPGGLPPLPNEHKNQQPKTPPTP